MTPPPPIIQMRMEQQMKRRNNSNNLQMREWMEALHDFFNRFLTVDSNSELRKRIAHELRPLPPWPKGAACFPWLHVMLPPPRGCFLYHHLFARLRFLSVDLSPRRLLKVTAFKRQRSYQSWDYAGGPGRLREFPRPRKKNKSWWSRKGCGDLWIRA